MARRAREADTEQSAHVSRAADVTDGAASVEAGSDTTIQRTVTALSSALVHRPSGLPAPDGHPSGHCETKIVDPTPTPTYPPPASPPPAARPHQPARSPRSSPSRTSRDWCSSTRFTSALTPSVNVETRSPSAARRASRSNQSVTHPGPFGPWPRPVRQRHGPDRPPSGRSAHPSRATLLPPPAGRAGRGHGRADRR